ncbi:hypothetical protein M5689_019780 [Euphorbia peplus]|nr:hypothetical protein M5689_019780 [Euphorbia peplus]
MANLSAKKSITKPQKHNLPIHLVSGNFNNLPTHLVADILAIVASKSFTDLFNAKETCKDMFQAALEDHVFECVSIESFPVIAWKKKSKKAVLFLEKCITVGNPESLFRRGMIDYFSDSKRDSGMEYLRKASEKGHSVAKYVCFVIMFCYGGKFREECLKNLNSGSGSKSGLNVETCRMKVKNVVKSMWVVRDFIIRSGGEEEMRLRRENCGCRKTVSFLSWSEITKKNMGWRVEEEFDDGVSCDGCLWDVEAIRFCNMLRTGRFSNRFVY